MCELAVLRQSHSSAYNSLSVTKITMLLNYAFVIFILYSKMSIQNSSTKTASAHDSVIQRKERLQGWGDSLSMWQPGSKSIVKNSHVWQNFMKDYLQRHTAVESTARVTNLWQTRRLQIQRTPNIASRSITLFCSDTSQRDRQHQYLYPFTGYVFLLNVHAVCIYRTTAELQTSQHYHLTIFA